MTMIYQSAQTHTATDATNALHYPRYRRIGRSDTGENVRTAASATSAKTDNTMLMETRQLPRSIQSFIRLIGLSATWRVLKQFGGRTVYIPKRLRCDCVLLAALSNAELHALAQYYGGETVDLPKADTIERHQRNLAIAAASAAGVSRAELVAHYGLSRRQIGNIRRQYRTLIERLSTDEED